MSCEAWRRKLERHVDGELPQKEVAPLEEHLRGCAECRAWRADLEGGRLWLADLAEEELDTADLRAVRTRVRARLAEPRPAPPFWKGLAPIALAAGLITVLGILWNEWERRPAPTPRLATATRPPAAPTHASAAEPPTAAVAVPSARAGKAALNVRRAVAATPLRDETASQEDGAPLDAADMADESIAASEGAEQPTVADDVSEPPVEPVMASAPRPTVVKLFTDDPNVTIHWILEDNGGRS